MLFMTLILRDYLKTIIKMADKQIDKKDIKSIVNNIQLLECFERVFEMEWLSIAAALSVPPEKVLHIRRDLQYIQCITFAEAFVEIIDDWVSRNGRDATRERLSRAFSSIGLGQFAELVGNRAAYNEVNGARKAVLQNPLILKEIFKNLKFEDRKSFRLVHSSWMQETRLIWEKKTERAIYKLRRLLERTRYIPDSMLDKLLMKCYDSGEDFNAPDEKGMSLLFLTVKGRQCTTVFEKLILLKANVFQVDFKQRNLLHYAVHFNHLEAIKFFMGKHVNACARDIHRRTPPAYYNARMLW